MTQVAAHTGAAATISARSGEVVDDQAPRVATTGPGLVWSSMSLVNRALTRALLLDGGSFLCSPPKTR